MSDTLIQHGVVKETKIMICLTETQRINKDIRLLLNVLWRI